MKDRLQKAWERTTGDARQLALAVITALVLLSALAGRQWVLPAYDRWGKVREQVAQKLADFERLSGNLQYRAVVDERLAALGQDVVQADSDAKTLSTMLVNLEQTARDASVNLVNLRPEPVQRESGCCLYEVRLSVAGELGNILRFVHQVTDGAAPVGLRGVSLRALQGSQQVESVLTLQMARLEPAAPAGVQP